MTKRYKKTEHIDEITHWKKVLILDVNVSLTFYLLNTDCQWCDSGPRLQSYGFFEYHTKRSISLAFHVCLIEAENVRFHLCICSLSMALVFLVRGVDHLYQKRINWNQIATTDIDKIVWMVGRNKRRLRSLTDFIERFCLVYRVFHAMFVFHDHHSEFQIDWILFYRFNKWIGFFFLQRDVSLSSFAES